MNKKQAEEEAVKKAKEATHAAGKNTGMSGRDLVRLALCPSNDSLPSPFLSPPSIVNLIAFFSHSLHSTPSGSKRRRKRKKTGIWTSIENRRRRKTMLPKWKGFGSFRYRMAVESEPWFVLSRLVPHTSPVGSSLVPYAPG